MARHPMTYAAAMDSLNVETNTKYQPSGGFTYCNKFAHDVMNHANIASPLPGTDCASIYQSLAVTGHAKWLSVDFQTAHSRAAAGNPTIALTAKHIAVVRPYTGTVSTAKDLVLSQAGSSCFKSKTLNYCWDLKVVALSSIKFFSYYD